MPLLAVKNLSIGIKVRQEIIPVVHGISFAIEAGQTLGLIGESGCGKSLTSLAIMGLLPHPVVQVISGEIWFDGVDLLTLSANERRALMGTKLAMIFQEPMTSLNPVYKVGDQICESLMQHKKLSKKAAWQQAGELLSQVGIPEPFKRLHEYPHKLSGGMRQRVMIAMALSCDPIMLIADEPTTALDVTVQAQILDLLNELQKKTGMAILLISHDLGVIAQTCVETSVMYRGHIIEKASTIDLFDLPSHPYTVGLLKSIPSADEDVERLEAIDGRVPIITEEIVGCDFNPRCIYADDQCRAVSPKILEVVKDHFSKCHFSPNDLYGGQS